MSRGANRLHQKLQPQFPCREDVCDCNDENIQGVSQTNPSDIVYISPGYRGVSDLGESSHRSCTKLGSHRAGLDSDKKQ